VAFPHQGAIHEQTTRFHPDRINGGDWHHRHPERHWHTGLLQAFVPYRTAVELCAIESGGTSSCDAGAKGIPSPKTTRYVSGMSIAAGKVTLTGQESLNGLTVTLTPVWSNNDGIAGWQRVCASGSDEALKQACEDTFRFTAE